MALQLERRENGFPVVSARGELDLHTQRALKEELESLEQGNYEQVGVDLQEVDFIDSAGVYMLRESGRRLKKAGRKLVLIGASPQVRRVFTLLSAAGLLNTL